MANNTKKAKDPTEVALSAIQEALNISDPAHVDRDPSAIHADHGPINSSAVDLDSNSFDARIANDRPSFDQQDEQRFARRPANDDRETIGQILQALQKNRPARNVYTLATLFAGVWIVGAGLLTVAFLPSLQALIGQGSGGTLALAGLAALLFAPILLFYFLASLAWRGQEMRLIAQSMAQVAIRFSEPEGAASD
ncbi:MAG: methyl-accepting chemotaxis protein, partial [Tardiphaga sp.]